METLMRVTHVAPTMFGSTGLFGGGERYPLELARAIARHVGTRLVVFGPKARSFREESGLEVMVLRKLFLLKRHPAHPVGAGLFSATAGADIIHTHHLRSAPSRMSALVGRGRRQKIVVTDHGFGRGGWGGALNAMFDGFLVVSEFSARTLSAPAERTTTIYGGVDPQRFHPEDTETRSGALFLGRLTPHKGVDALLRATPDGTKLTIGGTSGHDRTAPERDYPQLLARLAARKDARFISKVSETDLPRLYRRAALFVLPTVQFTCYGRYVEIPELLGLSVIEAMASGTPVVCSRVGGIPEIVEDGVTGFLVEPGNTGQLRARIEELDGNKKLAARMGRAARERVLAGLTWEHCAQRCLQAYETLTASPPPRSSP
jgi:glycosyltransferase involved in cell wall biosynthesis